MANDIISVDSYWSHYEKKADNFEQLLELVSDLSRTARNSGRVLAWRGQKNSSWALHSTLYRKINEDSEATRRESDFLKFEKRILVELRRWGLHSQRGGGRLSVLSQLAFLQHFGAPTRLLDITHSALVGAFFACEDSDTHNSGPTDGRLYVFDITDRSINETSLRAWEDLLDTPWSKSNIKRSFSEFQGRRPKIGNQINESSFAKNWEYEWSTKFFAWKPPSLAERMAAQSGGFLLGGIVGTLTRDGFLDLEVREDEVLREGRFQVPDPRADRRMLPIDNLRNLTCLAIKPSRFPDSPSKKIRINTNNAVWSIRISSQAKKEIMNSLDETFGISRKTLFPDFPGFSDHIAKSFKFE